MNAAAEKKKKFFTLDEANRRLPLVRAIVEDIVKLYHDVHERRERLERIRPAARASARRESTVYSEEVQQIEEDIEKEKSKVGKGFRVDGFAIDYTKCMFCALCVDPCPVDCIFMGSNYDLSCYSRDGCVVDYAKLPLEVAWGQATLNPTAVAESKVLYEPVWVKGEPSPFEYSESTD